MILCGIGIRDGGSLIYLSLFHPDFERERPVGEFRRGQRRADEVFLSPFPAELVFEGHFFVFESEGGIGGDPGVRPAEIIGSGGKTFVGLPFPPGHQGEADLPGLIENDPVLAEEALPVQSDPAAEGGKSRLRSS